jgi:hypothetical protein
MVAKIISPQKPKSLRALLFLCVVLLLLFVQIAVFLLVPGQLPSWAKRAIIPAEREETYRLAALLIKRQLELGQSVAANEVGVIGYYLDNAYILDVAGLMSPQVLEVTKQYPEDKNYITMRLLARFKPNYIISLRGFFADGVLDSIKFNDNYSPLATLYGEEWGRDGLLIFKRNDSIN